MPLSPCIKRACLRDFKTRCCKKYFLSTVLDTCLYNSGIGKERGGGFQVRTVDPPPRLFTTFNIYQLYYIKDVFHHAQSCHHNIPKCIFHVKHLIKLANRSAGKPELSEQGNNLVQATLHQLNVSQYV